MTEPELLEAARAGDEKAFQALCVPRRSELILHCYRFLGSMGEAEEEVQETLLRAWQGLKGFEGRSAFRSWLYRIATNQCLKRLEHQRPRLLSYSRGPSDPTVPPPAPLDESHWLEPAPELEAAGSTNPEAHYSSQESVNLAFLAALQHLPPRQRAVLILRDVVGWQASEVADLLDMGIAAVNSAHQRARDAIEEEHQPVRKLRRPSADERDSLLRRYMSAWSKGDVAGLVALLKLDATVSMPPIPTRFVGADIGTFMTRFIFGAAPRDRFWMEPTTANGQPAAAVWERDGEGRWRASGLHVLSLDGDRIAGIVAFLDPRAVTRFGFPSELRR